MEIATQILYEFWMEQKNLWRVFHKYLPDEELLEIPIADLTRAELTNVLLYKLGNQGRRQRGGQTRRHGGLLRD